MDSSFDYLDSSSEQSAFHMIASILHMSCRSSIQIRNFLTRTVGSSYKLHRFFKETVRASFTIEKTFTLTTIWYATSIIAANLTRTSTDSILIIVRRKNIEILLWYANWLWTILSHRKWMSIVFMLIVLMQLNTFYPFSFTVKTFFGNSYLHLPIYSANLLISFAVLNPPFPSSLIICSWQTVSLNGMNA